MVEGYFGASGDLLDKGVDGKDFVIVGGAFVVQVDFNNGHHDAPFFHFLVGNAEGTYGFSSGYLVEFRVVAVIDEAHLVHIGITGSDRGYKVIHGIFFIKGSVGASASLRGKP